MKIQKHLTVEIRTDAAVYFATGDPTGASEALIAEADAWYSDWQKRLGPITLEFREENEFTPFPEFGEAGSTTTTYVWAEDRS